MGRTYTGAGLVREHWEMVAEKYAGQWEKTRVWGHGNKAHKRRKDLLDRGLLGEGCYFCGGKPARFRSGSRLFCSASCANDYAS